MRNLVPGGQTTVLRIVGNSADRNLVADPRAYPARRDHLRAQQQLDADHPCAGQGARREDDHGREPRGRTPLGGGHRGAGAARGRRATHGPGVRDRQRARCLRTVPLVPRPPRPGCSSPAATATTSTGSSRSSRGGGPRCPSAPVTGPAFAELTWLRRLPRFMSAEPGVKLLTLHRYPLRACLTNTSDPGYPTIPNLLSDKSSIGLAQQVAPYVTAAHNRGLGFRLDEIELGVLLGEAGRERQPSPRRCGLRTPCSTWPASGVDGGQRPLASGSGIRAVQLHAHFVRLAGVRPPRVLRDAAVSPRRSPRAPGLVPVNVSPNGPVKVWATRSQDFQTRVS